MLVCKEVCALSHNHGSLSNVINSIRASAIKYGEMQHAGVLVQDVPSAVKFYTEVWYSNTPTPPNTNTQIHQQTYFLRAYHYHIRCTVGQGGCLV